MAPTEPVADHSASAPVVVRLSVRVAAVMLGAGAQTEDVEAAIETVCVSFGVTGVQHAVSFSSIQVSHDDRNSRRPTTFVYAVRERKNDFARLARSAAFIDQLKDHQLTLDQAEEAVDHLERPSWPYSRVIEYMAPPLSATGSTLVFGGSGYDALATFVIAFTVQPVLAGLDRSTLPPFFRSVFGAALSTLLAGLFVGLDLPITGGLVLTGALLGLLPGYALVSGFRDLIDQSIVSGTARLAEAFLLGAGVAGGTALGIAVASNFGVRLSILTAGIADWSELVSVAASLLAVGAFAVRLGVPRRYVWQAALLGSLAWISYLAISGGNRTVQASLATFAAALLVGIAGRLIARRERAPTALWVVPAILPLLPGLQIVLALLAPTDQERIAGMAAAATTAFTLGVGVGMGDIIIGSLLNVRDRVVGPAVNVVVGGVDDLLITPVGRIVADTRGGRPRSPRSDEDAGQSAG